MSKLLSCPSDWLRISCPCALTILLLPGIVFVWSEIPILKIGQTSHFTPLIHPGFLKKYPFLTGDFPVIRLYFGPRFGKICPLIRIKSPPTGFLFEPSLWERNSFIWFKFPCIKSLLSWNQKRVGGMAPFFACGPGANFSPFPLLCD